MLIKNIKPDEFDGLEGEFYWDLFGTTIYVVIEEGVDVAYAEECVGYLQTLQEDLLLTLCEASIRYCNDFLEDIGENPLAFSNPLDVLREIKPNGIQIPERSHPSEIILDIELDCSWEVEHGMQWVIRDGRVMYVGAYNGINPHGDCDIGETWNYV